VAFALSYTSSNYTMKNARVVISGGKASSANYAANHVNIGKITSGKAESANYALNATNIDKPTPQIPPNPPILNPVTTPTNISTQELSGTKDQNSSICINGYEAVPINIETIWNCDWSLSEGVNYLIITSRNTQGLESDSVYATINLDTMPPIIQITSPLDGSTVTGSP